MTDRVTSSVAAREYSEYLPHVSQRRLHADADLESGSHDTKTAGKAVAWSLLLQTFSTLGVVYGDIGTSPLYVLSSVFADVPMSESNLYGVVSCIFWSLTLLLVTKYALIVLHADDNGNGGAFALYAQLKRSSQAALLAWATAKDLQLPAPAESDIPPVQSAFHDAAQEDGFLPSDNECSMPNAESLATKATSLSLESDYPVNRPLTNSEKSAAAAAMESAAAAVALQGSQNAAAAATGLLPSDLVLDTYVHDEDVRRKRHWFTVQLRPTGWRTRVQTSLAYQRAVRLLVVAAVGFLLGDGVLTPSVSVTSAVEGLQVVAPSINRDVIIAIACIILLALFTIQMLGTGKVSLLFAPVVFLWLALNFGIGMYNIFTHDAAVFKALSPYWAVMYFVDDPEGAWRSLSAVLLSFTGVEALFADLGHFSRPSIQLSCLIMVFPSIIITYLGQAAYLTEFPKAINNVYYESLPNGMFWPMFLLAAAATVVASQALISAVFSIVMQAIAQGFFPRFAVKHTNAKHIGQVYINAINWLLAFLCIILVIAFKSSANLTKAYGLAVNFDLILTTVLMTGIILFVWRLNVILAIAWFAIFFSLEGLYLSSSLLKVPVGGWVPLLMAAVYSILMLAWYYGTSRKQQYIKQHAQPIQELVTWSGPQPERLLFRPTGRELYRFEAAGFFYSPDLSNCPVLKDFMARTGGCPKLVFAITNRFVSVPTVSQQQRLLIEPLSVPGFYHVVARYGYMEQIKQDRDFSKMVIAELRALLAKALHAVEGGLLQSAGSRSRPHFSLPFAAPSAASRRSADSDHFAAAALELSKAALFNGHQRPAEGLTPEGPGDHDCVADARQNRQAAALQTLSCVPESALPSSLQQPAELKHLDATALADVAPLSAAPAGLPDSHRPAELLSVQVSEEADGVLAGSRSLPVATTARGEDKLPRFKHVSAPVQEAAPKRRHPFVRVHSSLPRCGLPVQVLHAHASQQLLGSAMLSYNSADGETLQRQALNFELKRLQDSNIDVVYVFGQTHIKAAKRSNKVVTWGRSIVLDGVFALLARNLGSRAHEEFNVPPDAFLELGSIHYL